MTVLPMKCRIVRMRSKRSICASRSAARSKESTARSCVSFSPSQARTYGQLIYSPELLEKEGGKSQYTNEYRPKVGVVTLSDSVSAGKNEDVSGPILIKGFVESGCSVDHQKVLPDGSEKLVPLMKDWIANGVELIITSGGTGLGERDLTIKVLGGLFDSRLPGVEQALHAYGRNKLKTAMLSRLTAGLIKNTIVICLPGSKGAAKDALNVLIPTIFHSFHMIKGEQH